MNFKLKLGDIQCIQKKFCFEQLIGIEKSELSFLENEKQLREAGVIYQMPSGMTELKAEYRYLFSSWEKVRFSLVRPDEGSEKELFLVMANEQEIILLHRVDEDVSIELVDLQADLLDRIILNMAPFDPEIEAEYPMSMIMSLQDFSQLISSAEAAHMAQWSKRLGVPAEVLVYYLDVISENETAYMFLSEDHKNETGSLIKIVNAPKGICALKHTTPAKAEDERMTLIIGNATQVADTIYVL